MRIDAIPIGKNPPDDVNVIIEVPLGGEPIKYEMDKAPALCSSTASSTRRCAIPATTASFPTRCRDDGDPIDVLVANTRAASCRAP